MKVCVIGAGIIGTTTAYQIKKRFPNAQVDIVAEIFSPNTTSDFTAGYWMPYLNPDTPKSLVRQVISDLIKGN